MITVNQLYCPPLRSESTRRWNTPYKRWMLLQVSRAPPQSCSWKYPVIPSRGSLFSNRSTCTCPCRFKNEIMLFLKNVAEILVPKRMATYIRHIRIIRYSDQRLSVFVDMFAWLLSRSHKAQMFVSSVIVVTLALCVCYRCYSCFMCLFWRHAFISGGSKLNVRQSFSQSKHNQTGKP